MREEEKLLEEKSKKDERKVIALYPSLSKRIRGIPQSHCAIPQDSKTVQNDMEKPIISIHDTTTNMLGKRKNDLNYQNQDNIEQMFRKRQKIDEC